MHSADKIPCMSPIPLGFQVPQEKVGRQTKLDPGHTVGNFPGDELEPPAGALMIKQNPVRTGNGIGFAIVQREIETRYLADAIGTSGMKRGGLGLRSLADFTEHFARSGEIEAALR